MSTLTSTTGRLLLAGLLCGAACTKAAAPVPSPSTGPVAPTPQATAPKTLLPDEVLRMPPDEVRSRVQAGEALLVCAYEDDAKYAGLKLEGSISMHELQKRLPTLPAGQELVFYCA